MNGLSKKESILDCYQIEAREQFTAEELTYIEERLNEYSEDEISDAYDKYVEVVGMYIHSDAGKESRIKMDIADLKFYLWLKPKK